MCTVMPCALVPLLLLASCATGLQQQPRADESDLGKFAAAARNDKLRPIPHDERLEDLSLEDQLLRLAQGPRRLPPRQPDVRGEVVFVDSDIVILRVTEAASESTPRGGSFALFRGDHYLAEARVVRGRDHLLACRVVRRMENATIMIGDRAATNP